MALLRLISQLISLLTGFLARHSLQELDRYVVLYSTWDDAALANELRRLEAGASQHTAANAATERRLRWISRAHEAPTIQALAIATCIFNRYPCDLPIGSSLYDEQKLAALALIDGANVQMDTGEGKTYVVALAAAALLVEHPQVIVLTANGYLAARDLGRVRPFLIAAGIASQLGVPAANFRGIAYTTLDDLCDEYLVRAYRVRNYDTGAEYPLASAILIDEIDSVLLDMPTGHSLVRYLPTSETMWEEAFALTESWDEQQYSYDPVTDLVSLTAVAWDEVTDLSARSGHPVSFLMDLVAAAVWTKHAKLGQHYLVDQDRIMLINTITGTPYTSAATEVLALQYLLFGEKPPVGLSLAEIDGLTLLRRHPYVVGSSATVADDMLFYLQQLRSLTSVIPARFARHPGRRGSVLSPSRTDTYRYIEQRIREVEPRPVIIGTWSPAEAQVIGERLLAEGVVDADHLGVITVFDSSVDASIMDAAGSPGRVTVISQGGSRGVDIRSLHNPLLIVLGLAREPRLQKQFLGRVGRHGEEFESEVVVDPSSPIWPVQSLLRIGVLNQPMPFDRFITRTLGTAQRDAWVYRVRRRQQYSIISAALGDMESAMAARLAKVRQLAELAPSTAVLHEELACWIEDGVGQSPVGSDREAMDQLREALRRRRADDSVVERFQLAVSHALAKAGKLDEPFEALVEVGGKPREMAALTSWLETQDDLDMDAPQQRMFQRQAELAALQRLPAAAHPRWRNAVDVVFESLLMANSTQLTQAHNLLNTLAVSSSRESYYRRGAFAVRNQRDITALAIQVDLVNHLRVVDRPSQLDDLFYSREHQVLLNPTQRIPEQPPISPSSTSDRRQVTLPRVSAEAAVERFIENREKARGGLPLAPAYVRMLLLEALRPVIGATAQPDSTVLTKHVELILDSLAGRGTRGKSLRDHRNLISEFIDLLNEDGLLDVRIERHSTVATALRRVSHFMQTIPKFGVLAVLCYFLVFALGLLIVATPSRHSEVLDPLSAAMGFGVRIHPALTVFAGLLGLFVGLRALGLREPETLVTRLTPIVAVTVALFLYLDGWSSLGRAIAIAVALLLWAAALSASQRFVLTMVGVNMSMLIGAGSVIAFAVHSIVTGSASQHAALLIGVIASSVGPGIPASVGFTAYSQGTFHQSDERTRIRISIDATLMSAAFAFIVSALTFGLHGSTTLAMFGASQFLMLSVLALLRLRPQRIQGLLAEMRIGSSFDGLGLQRYLRRAAVRSAVVAASVLALTFTTLARAGMKSTWTVLVDQWSGLVLVAGIVGAIGMFSVAGAPVAITHLSSGDEPSTWQALRKRLRAWRRLRFAWVVELIIAAALFARPLFWLMKAVKLTVAMSAAWHRIFGR